MTGISCQALLGRILGLHALAGRWRAGLGPLLALLVVLGGIEAQAQSTSSVSGLVRTSGGFTENFLQAPDSGPQQDVWSGRVEVRIEQRVGIERRVRGYTRFELLHYQLYGYGPAVLAGLARDGSTHSFDAAAGFQWNRPRFDESDIPERADVAAFTGRYGLRIGRAVDLFGVGGYRLEYTTPLAVAPRSPLDPEPRDIDPHNDADVVELGGGLRVRGFGRTFSPEVGYTRSVRHTDAVAEDYYEDALYVLVRSSLGRRVYLSGRYRHRLRDYLTESPRDRNYGREDRRRQLSGSVELGLTRNLLWSLSAALERGDSTRAGRDFVTSVVESGVGVRF